MLLDHQVAQLLPFENVELIVSGLYNPNKEHDETSHWISFHFPHDLALVVKFDVAERLRRCACRFDLNRDVFILFVRRDDVVMRNVTSECDSDKPSTREFCGPTKHSSACPTSLLLRPVPMKLFLPRATRDTRASRKP